MLLEGSQPVVNKRGQDGFLSGVRRIQHPSTGAWHPRILSQRSGRIPIVLVSDWLGQKPSWVACITWPPLLLTIASRLGVFQIACRSPEGGAGMIETRRPWTRGRESGSGPAHMNVCAVGNSRHEPTQVSGASAQKYPIREISRPVTGCCDRAVIVL